MMNAYVHNYRATLYESEYVVTLHVVALGDHKFAETLSVADARTLEPIEVCGHMSGSEWGFNGLPKVIRETVATAYAHNNSPYVASDERVGLLAKLVDYKEAEPFGNAFGTVLG